MIKISKLEIFNIFEWLAVGIVSIQMIIYGLAKPVQFDEISSYTEPINTMKPMTLMWAFYSFSKTYAIIIGIFETMGAILFSIPRTRLFGGVILSCILINIILQDYFFEVNVGALGNAVLFQLLILIVFFKHRDKITNSFRALQCQFNYKIRLIYIPVAVLIIVGIEILLLIINNLLKYLHL